MKINWKKLLIIIGFVLLVLAMAFILYYVFFKPLPPPPTPPSPVNVTPPTLPPPAGLVTPPPVAVVPPVNVTPPAPTITPPSLSPIASPTGFTTTSSLVRKPTAGVTLASNGVDLLYYEKEAGKFYRVTPDGALTLLTDQVFYNVSKVNWAPNKTKAVLEYPDGSNILYDFETKTQVTLPKQWKDFSFSPDGNKIVFKEINFDPENRWITIANPDGSGRRSIEHLGTVDQNVIIDWSPQGQIAALFYKGYDANRSEVFPIGLYQENFKSLIVEGRDLRIQWSPTGDRLLYSVFNTNSLNKPTLWATNALPDQFGERRINFKLNTWADKCTFADNSTVYCAVPSYLPEGSGYYPELADNIPDLIFKLDLEKGTKTFIAEPLGGPTISQLAVSADKKILYFVYKSTGQISKINLE